MGLGLTYQQKQIGSVLLTFLVYTLLINWPVALLMVVAVGFHEYSHLFAASKLGLKTKGFFLLPFMGGVAFIADEYKTQKQNAIVALAGPAGGALLALVTFFAYKVTGNVWLGQATAWMCLLNLFNLLPLSFMDGGQTMGTIMYSLNRSLGFYCLAGSTVLALVVLLYLNPLLAFIVFIFGGRQVFHEWYYLKAYKSGDYHLCPDYYLNPPKSLSKTDMIMVVIGWMGISIILALMIFSIAPDNSLYKGGLFSR